METLVYSPTLKAPDGTGYNDFPLGWREITEEEFSKSKFWIYGPVMFETRQMYHKGTRVTDARLYWLHDKTGFAMSNNSNKVQYYVFGCDHKYTELSQEECSKRNIYHAGKCYHVSECKLCKTINSYDSGD